VTRIKREGLWVERGVGDVASHDRRGTGLLSKREELELLRWKEM